MNPLEQPTNRPSAESQCKLDEAKTALKEIVDKIPHEKLMAMDDPIVSYFIIGCDGDVDKYTRLKMEDNAGNAPDVAAFHVTKNLILIKEYLENKD